MTNENNLRTHYRACNLCEAICGLEIKINAQNEIVSIRGDAQDPFSRGYVCPKAVALKDIYHDPNRLKEPVRRTPRGWERIGWDEAFTEVANKLKEIQRQHGKDAVGVYLGNPTVHNSGTLLTIQGLLKALGTRNRFSATSVDQLPHHFAAWAMFGHPLLIPLPDIDRTDFMLILGANPLASNGSLMTAPGVGRRLKAIQERGGKIIVIDPRRTETAKAADKHFFIKPASDVYFLLALLNVLLKETLLRPRADFVAEEDIEKLSSLIEDYTPESIATHTGISAEDVRALAKDFATAPRAVVYGRMGVSVQTFGGVCHWLINIINLLTGNFDREGGAMFPSPAFDLLSRARRGYNCFNRWQSGVRSLPEFEGEFPVAAMAEEIEVGNIKAIFTIGGNPVLSTPNGTALDKAFASLNFMVSFDIYINETTRHANIILPPTTGLEAAHYDVIFHHLAVRNTAKFSEPLFEKEETQRHDWEILEELRYRLIGEESTPQNPEIKLALGLQYGRYGATGLTLEKLKAEPHGIDLGTLQPVMPERLLTENGRINLLPDLLVKDLKRVKNNLSQSQNNGYDLLLIGRRHLRSNNSWMHNTERLMKGRERCTLLIHPVTAECLGIQNKETVRVESRVGSISAPIEITEDIMPDVVSLPHGFGHGREGVQLDIATQYAGASINDLTDHLRIDELTGNAAFSGVPVRIEKTT